MPDNTPMMQQYARTKAQYRDAVLFFRLGDFYEMFKQDAIDVSRLLGLTLTQRNGVPMCGIPYHASRGYIGRLIAAGKKIAICEQVRLAPDGKGLAEREVIEVITPGTVTEEDYLEASSNNYLLGLASARQTVSIGYIDLATGRLCLTDCPIERIQEYVRCELVRLRPREILLQESLLEVLPHSDELFDGCLVNRYPDWAFDVASAERDLCETLGVVNLKGFGIDSGAPVLASVGVLLEYLRESIKTALPQMREVLWYRDNEYVVLDESTQRNLELTQNMQDRTGAHTLWSVVSDTRTAMGARRLRSWLLYPLKDREAIVARQDAVERMYHEQLLLQRVRELLSGILDLERLAARIAVERAHAKDLVAIRNTLGAALQLDGALSDTLGKQDSLLRSESRARAAAIRERLQQALLDEPSILLTEGNIMRAGWDTELDELRELRDNSKAVLERYLHEERELTGINALRLRQNRVLGYYFELTKANLAGVPEYFIRRQSLSNVERFTTARLGELEEALNSAAERIVELERRLFVRLRDGVAEELSVLYDLADALAHRDCIQSFAFTATRRGYTRPVVEAGTELVIHNGRHPVVEAYSPAGSFVANDLELGTNGKSFALITGPNMAGKSTFLRQTALIVLLAQTGCFVPAEEARIGLVDRIFCRVGATDNLARGESTFLVEMNETANILRNTTATSLVIMDEVGRGTSTRDGLAIAWAVSEHLARHTRPRTLFATHFHELTELDEDAVFNLSLAVSEQDGEVVFLKRVREGPSSQSYGVQVARIAGLPEEVLQRAYRLMEDSAFETSSPPLPGRKAGAGLTAAAGLESERTREQNELFDPAEIVANELSGLELDRITPIEALNILARWKNRLNRCTHP